MADLSVMVGQERDGSVSVLRLEGDIDASTHKLLEEKASEAIVKGAENILLDMSGVKYMGSAGFRSLHTISNMLESGASTGMGKSRHLKLLSPSEEVLRVIKTLGFDVYLDIFTDRNEAVSSF